jgi:hypothetical protein
VSTVALRRPGAFTRLGTRQVGGTFVWETAGLLALVGLAFFVRTRHIGTGFWIDEGLSVGIGSHPLTHIPGLLRQDGSPPLYYMVLHVWMQLFGRSVQATHWFSLLCAQAAIPVAFWSGTKLFDRTTGWWFAGLIAINPFLTSYAQETRMYALMILFAIPCVTCFLLAYVEGRRAYRIPFGVLLALMLWTHNWGLFLGVAFALAFVVVLTAAPPQERRPIWRDGLVGFGTTAILYAPWLPTLLYQSRHTGAPWAEAPSLHTLLHAPDRLLGGQSGWIVVLLVGGFGLSALAGRSARDRRVLVPVLLVLGLAPILLGWLSSHVSPAWATRYLAIGVAPLVLAAAVGMQRAARLGLAGAAVLAILWLSVGSPDAKSNAHYVAKTTYAPMLHDGDTVISTQPEQVPVLEYYMPRNLRLTWVNPFGYVKDTGVVDWRDGTHHFDTTGVDTQLEPELSRVKVGQQVLFVRPIIYHRDRWDSPWSSRVADRSAEYLGALLGDPRFKLLDIVPTNYGDPGPNPLQGLLFRKVNNGPLRTNRPT